MEYGEAINDQAVASALRLARRRLAEGRLDLSQIAAETVTQAYCTCVTAGEDAAERVFSRIHRDLIDGLERLLRRAAEQEAL